MPRYIYVGSHAEVVLPDGTICQRDKPVELSKAIDIEELEASGNWRAASTASSTAKAKE